MIIRNRTYRPQQDYPAATMADFYPAAYTIVPRCQQLKGRCHMVRLSEKFTLLPGSVPGGNQQS